MAILNGWKQIAESLNLTSRTAQRWEQLGLPVRRVSNSRRSPVIASSQEIKNWAQTRRKRINGLNFIDANTKSFKATQRKTHELAQQLETATIKLARQLDAIRNQIRFDRASPAHTLLQFPNRKP
jgi:phage terminase Nu1 subunit (DNA packaging protein)